MDESDIVNQEDDFDAFNDETFGDGGEYNWEANQALGSGIFGQDLPNGSRQEQAKTTQKSLENFDLGIGSRQVYEEYENYEGQSREYDDLENNENALEESISRLVLDDFEEDEEDISNDKLRRIAAVNRSSYAVFMPPQVVNRHLQWFMDKDLPGGSSLLGSSVWSMHPTSITPKASDVDIGSGISNDHSSPVRSSEISARNNLDAVSSSTSALAAGSDLGSLLNLSQQRDSSSARPPPGLNNITPAFKTVDEIEQELLRESDLRQKTAEVKKKAPETGKPKILSVEELERELIQGSPIVPKPAAFTSVQAQSNQNVARPPGPSVAGHAERSQHFDANRMPFPFAGVQPSSHPSQTAAGPITSTSGAGPMGYVRHGINARPVHPRPMVYPHNNFAQHIMNTPGIAAHQAAALQQLHNLRQQQQQQQLRFLQMNPNSHSFRPVGFPMPPNQRNNVPVGYNVNPLQLNNAASQAQRKLDTKTEDRDVGLMTEKDKQRLKNIQIVQLQNDHPHTTDYYCLMRKVRLGGSGQPPMDLLRMLFPRRIEEDDNNRRHYEPAHFENSLGKLQAQSALAPKKAIDTVIRVTDSGPVAGKKKYRYLLLEIEKIYDILLALEEADLRTALQTSGNDADEKELKNLRAKVERVLHDPKKLSEVMSVRKGKFLVCRLVALIDQPARMVALLHLFNTFPTWSVSGSGSGSSELVELFPYIRHCILNMDVRSVESLIAELKEELIESMIITKLGVSLLMVLLHQGEKLISSSQMTDQFKTLWNRQCVIPILAALLRYKQTVVPPVEIYNIGLQRLLTSDIHRLNSQIKEELTKLLNTFLNAGTKLIKQDY